MKLLCSLDITVSSGRGWRYEEIENASAEMKMIITGLNIKKWSLTKRNKHSLSQNIKYVTCLLLVISKRLSFFEIVCICDTIFLEWLNKRGRTVGGAYDGRGREDKDF